MEEWSSNKNMIMRDYVGSRRTPYVSLQENVERDCEKV
jgi:hypothetical protein